tara:strand:- start:626 stop:1108 length:483 start_codon:yes stop_codon:yes gene_type:complete
MSNQIYVISDLHFGHINMARHRGFETVEKHDQFIIDQWNKVVTKRDTVWILGDITMEKKAGYYLLDQLKGFKRVVLGNHDRHQDVPTLLEYVDSVCGMAKVKGFILTHCPVHPSELNRFKLNVHGHVHENSLVDPRYINVSCENVNYTPQLLSNYGPKTE